MENCREMLGIPKQNSRLQPVNYFFNNFWLHLQQEITKTTIEKSTGQILRLNRKAGSGNKIQITIPILALFVAVCKYEAIHSKLSASNIVSNNQILPTHTENTHTKPLWYKLTVRNKKYLFANYFLNGVCVATNSKNTNCDCRHLHYFVSNVASYNPETLHQIREVLINLCSCEL